MRRVELLTSCLQGRRSSQLSYTPMNIKNVLKNIYIKITIMYICTKVHWKINNENRLGSVLGKALPLLALSKPLFLLRKEVIQPHLLIRLPCYDFTPIIDSTFDCCLYKLAHRLRVFPTLMVWRAVCTRPGNVFTAVCWPAITSNSGFMKANFSLQSELRLLFGFCLISLFCFPLLQPL